jgi:hypothetical protein
MGQVNNLNRALFRFSTLRQDSIWHLLLGGAAFPGNDNWQIF